MIKRAANCSPRHGISDVITALTRVSGEGLMGFSLSQGQLFRCLLILGAGTCVFSG